MLSHAHLLLLDWIADHPSTTIEETAVFFDIEAGAVAELWADLVEARYLAPPREHPAYRDRGRRPAHRGGSSGRLRIASAPGRCPGARIP
jgi:hypothetical protein